MASQKITLNLTGLIPKWMSQPDPMLSMLEWLCTQLPKSKILEETSGKVSAVVSYVHSFPSKYFPKRIHTQNGDMYLLVPIPQKKPYFVPFGTNQKCSDIALIQILMEIYDGANIFTLKAGKLAKNLGKENLSPAQVAEMANELDGYLKKFYSRPLSDERYPILWLGMLYEKVCCGGRVVNRGVLVACGVNSAGILEVLAANLIEEESRENYLGFLEQLKGRRFENPILIVSGIQTELTEAIKNCFPGVLRQSCKKNLVSHILNEVESASQAEKDSFENKLKLIWRAPDAQTARKTAFSLSNEYVSRFPRAIQILNEELEASLTFYHFAGLDSRKISSFNMLERLRRTVQRRTRIIGNLPNSSSYYRLAGAYLMEYAEEWSAAPAYLNQKALQDIVIYDA